MTWKKSSSGNHYLIFEEKNYKYEAVIGKDQAEYDLTICFRKLKKSTNFYSAAYCKTIAQAKQLEALTRLNIMEIYL